MSKNIAVNLDGVNTYYSLKPISRLYCGYGDNNVETGGVQDTWYDFSNPDGGVVIYRNQDWEQVPNTVAFKYVGSTPKWFDISATCNILKGSGGNASQTIELQWNLNGARVGGARQSHMNNINAQIITGNGQLYLNTNDIIKPQVRNIENGDTLKLYNCQFNIREDFDATWYE